MTLKIQGLNKSFDGLKVIDNLNIELKDGEVLAIVGPSGCGKSTILNIISGVIKEFNGKIENNMKQIGYVFQEDRILPWKTVYENIKIVNDESKKEEILKLIEEVGLKGFESYYPHKLSGGMRQRCAIARAFNYKCDLLLMDEPFKSLDYNLRIDMLKSLTNLWNKNKKSILFVTHEIDEALLIAHRILILSKRPTKVLKEIYIDENIGNRDLTCDNIIKFRKSIIELLM
ncbi:ABC transporter ATP-binding protein [Clostridium botulinum]|nr:ABC transporter ATP-binding protein [Clostridium botulinum]